MSKQKRAKNTCKVYGTISARIAFIGILLTVFLLSNSASAASGVKTILVNTNRYSVETFNPQHDALSGYDTDNSTFTFTAGALVMGTNGLPVSGENVLFEIRNQSGGLKASGTKVTGPNGVAFFAYSVYGVFATDSDSNYGTWTVKASIVNNTSINRTVNVNFTNTNYVAGCSKGFCHHNPTDLSNITGVTSPRSPYSDKFGFSTNSSWKPSMAYGAMVVMSSRQCVICHPGYGSPVSGDNGHTRDYHNSFQCSDSRCHGAEGQWPVPIPSCFNSNCHPISNKNLTNFTTLATVNGTANVSIYSTTVKDGIIFPNNSKAIPYSVHNGTQYSNTTGVPCWICHGPMHNITRPDPLNPQQDNITEDSQCIVCHTTYSEHNSSVNCTLCHSQDAHTIKVFAQNASYVPLNRNTPNPARGNCTNCHQNASFFAALKAQPNAGGSTGRNPPQVTLPLNHSNDPNAGHKWNQTPGYWTNSSQVTWCQYCHGNTTHNATALGRPSQFDGNNTVNSTISTSSSWCASCHWQGYVNDSNTYNDMINTFKVSGLPVPPEITGNVTYGANQSNPTYYNHSSVNKDDASCKSCHGSLTTSTQITGLQHNVAIGIAGGPNCIACHNIGGNATGKLVNFTTMNDSSAIHKNLNSNATSPSGYSSANFKCWACHGNGSEPASGGHPANYKTPYNCTNCHVSNASQNFNFTPNNTLLNVSQHYWNGTNISTSSITSCYSCHNRTEMMLLAYDPDNGTGAVYGGDNGGNNSTSHYGKKRTDMTGWDTTTYCTYCHNTSTNNATFYVSNFNNTIYNHTSRATTPLCTTCHNNGRIHNSTLAKPISNDSFCRNCHGPGGTAATNNKVEHKTLYCTECHANSSTGTLAGKDIHGIKYLTQSNTFSTSNSNAVNCVTCHQTSIVDSSLSGFTPFKIQNPLHHSDNASNGSIWGNHWINTTPQTACIYCHNDTKHNSTPLGRILQWAPNYQMYGSIGANTSCSNCHYKGDSNYTQMNSAFTLAGLQIPPEITNGTSWNGNTNYYNHSLGAYDDLTCKNCHGSLLSMSANMSEFQHNVAQGMAGGANCTACHNIGGSAGAGRLVNFSALNDTNAIHRNLNSNAASPSGYPAENKKCWACHGNGSEPVPSNKHPSNYKTPYNCTNCHVPGAGQNMNFTPSTALLNVTEHYWNGTDIDTASVTSCYSCHNRTEMMLGTNLDPDGAASVYGGANGGSNSSSHYGKKRTDMVSMDSTTYCTYCHNTTTNNATFYVSNFNNTIYNHTSRATTPLCTTCHNNGRIHNSTLTKPVSNDSFCSTCHGIGGIAATNNKTEHKTLYCTECHANSSMGTLAGKDIHGIKYLTQSNTFSTSNSSAVNCVTCHQTSIVDSSLGSFSPVKIMNPLHHSDNASNGTLWGSHWTSPQGACIYCHSDTKHNATPLGRILQWAPNYTMYAAIGSNTSCGNCHYKGDTNYSQMNSSFTSAGLLIPPEITNGSSWNGNNNYYNHSLSTYQDKDCKLCHGSLLSGNANMSEFQHNVAQGKNGGPDCISCHNLGGSAGAGRLVNASAMNDTYAIHKSLNNGAANSSNATAENKKCWACHGNGSEPGSHPSNYKNPYRCPDCHVQSTGQNLNFTPASTLLNVSQHYWNGTNITTSGVTSCYSCHNRTEMMVGTNLDPDGAASVYGGANGGSNSSSHYGKKRTDMVSMDSTTYCTYCHNTTTNNATFYVSNFNNTIYNHTTRATTPLCTQCHNNGRIHNSTLVKPISNDTFCSTCHGIGGSAATNNKTEHKTLYCTECHANSSTGTLAGKDIHGIKFLTQSNTFSTSNSSAVNCVTCHQTSIVDSSLGDFAPFKIMNPLHHSDNTSNGSIWGNYWTNTTPQTACIYCHNDTKHSATPLGRILQWSSNYKMYGSIGANTSCADCHYRGDTNYTQMSSIFTSAGLQIPPEITNGTNWKGKTSNYYNHSLDNYTDQKCKSCHGSILSVNANMSEFPHNVAAGTAGDDCLSCHISQQGIYPAINVTFFGRHSNVNKSDGNNLTNSDCKTCHYDTTNMSNVLTYACDNCHTQGNYSAPIISNHRPPKQLPVAGANITTNAYCSDCHNNSINQFAYSINASVGHYGTNDTLLKPTVNQTSRPIFGFMNLGDASAYNKECNNCHNPSNATWGNPTLISTPHTSLGTCKECHVNGNASDLHNGSLSLPQTFSCLDCHTTYAAKYNAPNITNTAMPGYGTCDGGCHGAGNGNGTLDPSEHNTDRNYAGTPGSADTVLLNNQTSLTVPRGASVTVTSKVNDAAGGASRVGGAEYYIDTDPGIGKGIPMDAADGQYDAVNGAWENVTGTLYTSTLSDGNHTVYVRGMDIGKQWSGSQNASFTVQSIGYINGTVTSSGSPIAGAIVSTTGASYTTASDGNYSLIVPAGTYNVTASKQPAYNDSTANGVVVTPGNTTAQNFVLTLKPTGTISGVVTNT